MPLPLNDKNTLNFDPFDPHQKYFKILATIAKLRFLPTFFMRKVYFQRFWFELYGIMNGSNSFSNFKTGLPQNGLHNDVTGARNLPQKMHC